MTPARCRQSALKHINHADASSRIGKIAPRSRFGWCGMSGQFASARLGSNQGRAHFLSWMANARWRIKFLQGNEPVMHLQGRAPSECRCVPNSNENTCGDAKSTPGFQASDHRQVRARGAEPRNQAQRDNVFISRARTRREPRLGSRALETNVEWSAAPCQRRLSASAMFPT
jgi:hypothetical protein